MQELAVEKQIFSISSLNKSVKKLLESHFQVIWVEGEVSNLSRPSSGHLYFTLKDEAAQVRCAMFRLRNFARPVTIKNGMHILASAKISLYDARGDYQLIIEHIEERGEGILRRQFEQLKKRLAQEGLFDLQYKKPLPSFPKKIGVITSPTGAAIRDVVSVLNRRFDSLPVTIYPTQVQGEQAAAQIAQAIRLANDHNCCDVLILCRGGGSLEDLWSFNEEIVARAIFHSEIPIVSGVGHEVDFTIADFVADQRAATPSAAAELISPDKNEYLQAIQYLQQRLSHLTKTMISHHQKNVAMIERYFAKPDRILVTHNQMIDQLEEQLRRAMKNKLEHTVSNFKITRVRLNHFNPISQLRNQTAEIMNRKKTLWLHLNQRIAIAKQQLANTSRMLHTISPLQTLERGYSITTKEKHVIETIEQVHLKDNIEVQVRDGFLHCIVNEINKKKALD